MTRIPEGTAPDHLDPASFWVVAKTRPKEIPPRPTETHRPEPPDAPFGERPFPIGYSGSPSSPTRAAIINRMQRIQGFNYRPRD